jgi:DNA-directed RNA polymerase specialized sigma subunit
VLNDDSFARLVAEDVKNQVTNSQREYLRLPENWERWQRALKLLLENLNDQLAEIEARASIESARFEQMGEDGVRLTAEYQTNVEQRTRKILRFRFYVETRLDEVARLITVGSDEAAEQMRAVEFFRKAIERHQELIEENDFDYSGVDEALWLTLRGEWRFDDATILD